MPVSVWFKQATFKNNYWSKYLEYMTFRVDIIVKQGVHKPDFVVIFAGKVV